MAVAGIGVDVMDVPRMEVQARDAGFLAGLFTPAEIAYCQARHHPARYLAGLFAAKEAFFKALGVDGKRGLAWREVEILNDGSGHSEIALHGALSETARRREVGAIHLSLSHTRSMAIAQLVLESNQA